jgi:hypothetical protein
MQAKTTVIYLPCGPDASERWEIVAASLKAAGITDIRPAPMPSLQFLPRHERPALISTREI